MRGTQPLSLPPAVLFLGFLCQLCTGLALECVTEHCVSVMEHCVSVTGHCVSVTEHCVSVTGHCVSVTGHCVSVMGHCVSLCFCCSVTKSGLTLRLQHIRLPCPSHSLLELAQTHAH